jgi:ligand-binding SRPBCC domain-containing protein
MWGVGWQEYQRLLFRMAIYQIHRKQFVPQNIGRVFDFFSRAENLEALTPTFLRFQITRTPPRMEIGARIEYRLKVHGLPVRWKTIIDSWDPPHCIVDVQAKGPYRLWHHTHRFSSENGGTWIEDTVRYSLPFGPLGRLVNRVIVARDVAGIFDYRERKIRELFPD